MEKVTFGKGGRERGAMLAHGCFGRQFQALEGASENELEESFEGVRRFSDC